MTDTEKKSGKGEGTLEEKSVFSGRENVFFFIVFFVFFLRFRSSFGMVGRRLKSIGVFFYSGVIKRRSGIKLVIFWCDIIKGSVYGRH
jgi:hypothetical protein